MVLKMSYKTIQLPAAFVQQNIDPLVENKALGFSSRAHVVVEAIKEYVLKYKETHLLEAEN